MNIQKPLNEQGCKHTKGNNSNSIVLNFYLYYLPCTCKFYESTSMKLQNIKETKRYGHTVGRTDNVQAVHTLSRVCGV